MKMEWMDGTPPALSLGGLSSSVTLLPVPSPDKGGGFKGQVSSLPEVKTSHRSQNHTLASE